MPRDGWISFPALNVPKTEIEVENGEKLVTKPMETPIQAIGRQLLLNDRVSQADLCLATGLPWKISRLFRRLEILGFIEVEKEPRFSRGRPRKLGKLTASGIEYFTGLLRKADEEGNVESRASRQPIATREGGLGG